MNRYVIFALLAATTAYGQFRIRIIDGTNATETATISNTNQIARVFAWSEQAQEVAASNRAERLAKILADYMREQGRAKARSDKIRASVEAAEVE